MRKPHLHASLGVLALPLLTGLAQAGSKSSINLKAGVSAKDSSAEASAKGSSSDGVVPSDVPRDPRGIKGISPVWEEIAAGDAAIAANDVDKALKHYEAALKADSRSALAHYRLGEARKAKGQLSEAQLSFESAVKVGEREADIKAKALFALAALAERQNKLSEARSAWKRYQEHVEKHGEIKAFPASASERLRRLDAQEQLSKDYALVRDRIKKGDAASKK
jgi:tetratricopeptide (TPR) repeat protein